MRSKTLRVLFGLALFLLFGAASAEAANFTAGANGDWATATTWTPNGVPVAGDTVSIPSPRIVTVTGAQSAQDLTVNAGATLTINAGATLTMSGGSGSFGNNGTVNGSGTFRTQGTTFFSSSNTNFTVPLEINSGTTFGSGTINGSLTILSGATINTINQNFTVNGDVNINAGGIASHNSSFFRVNGANIVNNGASSGGVFQFGGTGTQNLSGSGTRTDDVTILSGSVTTLTGNVIFGNGAATTNFTVNTGGTLATNGNTLTLNKVGVSGAGTVSGAGLVRLQGASSIVVSAAFTAPLEINSGTTNGGNSTLGGSLSILNGATFNIFNGLTTVNGDITVNAGGTLAATSGLFTANGANIVNNGTISGGSFNFGGSGTQNLSGTGTLTAAVTVLNGSVTTLTSDVTIGSGAAAFSVTVNAGGTFAVGGNTLTLNRISLSVSGAFTGTGAGKIRTQGTSSVNVGAAFTGSLEVNSGITTGQSSTFGGSVSVLGGATLDIVNQTVTANGDLTINAGGTLTSSSGTFNANGANIVNNGSININQFRFGGTAQTLSGAGTTFSTTTAVTILSGSTVTLGSNHQMNTLAVNAGGTLNTAIFTLFLNGAGTPLSGAGTIANVNITYNGSAAQTVQTTASYNRLGIDNAAGVTLSSAETVNQRLILTNGAFNNGANLTIANNATIERNNGTLQTAPTLSGTVNVEYTGANNVTTALEFPTSASVVTNLVINKTSAANTLTLDANRTLNGALTLTNGQLLTGANTLFVGASGTSTGSANSFVIGTLQKAFAAPALFTYHVGTSTGYSPATINVDAGAGSFTVAPANGVIPGSGLDPAKTLQRYWNLTQTGITQADISFQYPQTDVPVTAFETQFRFVRNNGGASNTFFIPSSLNSNTNTFTLNNVTQFSPWTLFDLGPTAAPANISGRITRRDGSALAGVKVELINSVSQNIVKTTDSSGSYLFPSIQTGEVYVITVQRRGFTFSPASRVLNHLDEVTDLNFIAVRDLSTQAATSGSDFDGDGRADLAVFRPENGNWYLKRSSDNSTFAQHFGLNGDVPTAGDYDGDGVSDYAVFRPTENVWYLLRSSDNVFSAQKFGLNGDVPAIGDYDGDGKTDVAVYRPADGVWYIQNSSNGEMRYERFGLSTDKVVPADYDGDGKSDVALYRAPEGIWYILQSSNGQIRYEHFGIESDEPVSADFDGDGRTDIAVYRRAEGIWHILNSLDGVYHTIRWGLSGDTLVPADYDGDGKVDAAIYRNGDWYILFSSNGQYRAEKFGQANDKPIPKAF